MANVTYGTDFSILDSDTLDLPSIDKLTSEEIVMSGGGVVATLRGTNLEYDPSSEVIAGVMTGIEFTFNGVPGFSITGLSVDMSSTVFETGYGGEAPGIGAELAYWFRSDDVITGSAGNEMVKGYGGNDVINGGAGTDTAVYLGNRANYTISPNANGGFTVQDKTGISGTDTLVNVERLIFSDTQVALDIDGTAGQAYRLYKATLPREPDAAGLGFWIAQMENGVSLTDVAAGFVNSPEFKQLFGGDNPSNALFLTKLYENVLGRTYDQAGFDWWLGQLDTVPGVTQASVLAYFSESTEYKADIAEVIGSGFVYQPWPSH